MNCERIEKYLIAYLEGKASPTGRRRVQSHLSECAACRERAEQFHLLSSVLDELPDLTPSLAFDATLEKRIAGEPRRAGFQVWLVPSARMAIAVAALVVLSVWLTSQSPAPWRTESPLAQNSEEEFKMIKNLPVLEDYDVLANFDALSELPVQPSAQAQPEM